MTDLNGSNKNSRSTWKPKVYQEVTQDEKKEKVIQNITQQKSEPAKLKSEKKTMETSLTKVKTEPVKVEMTETMRRKRGERGSPKREEQKAEIIRKEIENKPVANGGLKSKKQVKVVKTEDIKSNYKDVKRIKEKPKESRNKVNDKYETVKVSGKAPVRKEQARSPPSRGNKTFDADLKKISDKPSTKVETKNPKISAKGNIQRPKSVKDTSNIPKEEKKEKSKTVLKFRSTKATELRRQVVREGSPKVSQSVQIEEEKMERPKTAKNNQRISRSPGALNKPKSIENNKKEK